LADLPVEGLRSELHGAGIGSAAFLFLDASSTPPARPVTDRRPRLLDVAVPVAGAAVVVGVMISAVVLRDPMVVVAMGLRERGRGRTPTDQRGHGKRRRDLFHSD
jgi:hypothetical protein